MSDKLILKKTHFYFLMLNMRSYQNNIEEECGISIHSYLRIKTGETQVTVLRIEGKRDTQGIYKGHRTR